MLDEGDFRSHDEAWVQLEKVLLVGYHRGFPIIRMERGPDGFEPRAFDPFGPKILATRRPFPDPALESRCLSFTLPVLDVLPNQPFQLPPEFWQEALRLRNKLLLWRLREISGISPDHFRVIPGLDPRTEIGLSLLAVIDALIMRAESPWAIATVDQLKALTQRARDERAESWEGLAAGTLIELAQRAATPGRVRVKDIVWRIQSEHEELKGKVRSREVAGILRKVFGLKVSRHAGNAWAFVSADQLGRLARTYGLTPPPTSSTS